MAKGKTNRRLKHGSRTGPTSAPVTLAPAPWDMGATGAANRIGLKMEEAIEADPETGQVTNPNEVKRMRRVDMIEVWANNGTISLAGYSVAIRLREAYEATMKAPGWPDNDKVQSSPKPDHAITIQIDRLSAYHQIARHIIAEDTAIIDMCVIKGRSPAHIVDKTGRRPYYGPGHKAGLAHIRGALDRLAEKI